MATWTVNTSAGQKIKSAGIEEIKTKIDSINIINTAGTFVMPTSGYSTVGTVRESGSITVSGFTVTAGSKYDIDLSDADSTTLTKIEALEGAGIIKFIRVNDTQIKVRLKDETALIASINMVVIKINGTGGIT